MDKAGGQRLEQLMEVILSRGGKGGQGASVEAVLERHNGIAVPALFLGGILSRHFHGALVGLRAGIGEEHLLHAGFFAQQLCQLGAGLGVIEVGGVLHLTQLFRHRRNPCVIGKAEGGDADAGAHVYIAFSAHVHYTAALAGDDLHGKPLICPGNVCLIHFRNAHISPP